MSCVTLVQRRASLLLVLCVLMVAGGCSGSDGSSNAPAAPPDAGSAPGDAAPVADAGPAGDGGDAAPVDAAPVDAGPDFTGATVITTAPASVHAGDTIAVTCAVRTRDGMTLTLDGIATPTVAFAPPNAVRADATGTIAVRAGGVDATCAFPALMLTGTTPAHIAILPGPAAHVVTTLDHGTVVAGARANATCAVTDAFGNAVAVDMPAIQLSPTADGTVITGLAAAVTHAGAYTVACQVPGAAGDGAALTVLPALPASLHIARIPDQTYYAPNQDIDIVSVVSDRYGNPIPDAMVALASVPAGTVVRPARFEYPRDGRYTVTGTVTGPTQNDVPLTDSTAFIVDSGPAIQCDPTMVNAAPGAAVAFHARINDFADLTNAQVNGHAVTPGADGAVTADVTSRFGMNFVDVSVTDAAGIANSRTCPVLVAGRWSPEDALLDSAVTLQLTPAGVDDGAPAAPITSLGDVLQTVLNSPGLHDQLNTALLANNPLKHDSCDQNACLFGGCVCLFHSSVTYLESQLNGPNTAALAPVDGGLHADVRFSNVRLRLRIDGTVGTTGWVTFDSLDVGVTFDVSAAGGRPHATVRPGSVSVNVGHISTDFSGLTGVIVNIVASLAQGTLRDAVANLLRGYVTDNFGRVLDGVVGGLDVSSLGASFNVPRLDGAGTLALHFGAGLSSLQASAQRMLFGLGTRFTTTAARATPSLGVPLPPAPVGPVPLSRPTTVTVQPGMLNQVLHTLWRGGFFDTTVPGSRLGSGVPAGTTIAIRTGLPPVASLRDDGRIVMDLGAMEGTITAPGLLSAPLRVSLGARASTAVTFSGRALHFGAVTVDELHVSLDDLAIPMADRDTLVGALRTMVQGFVDSSLNNALPAIPIPGFQIPASLGGYGLPTGRELGLTSPAFATEGGYLVLRGGFGVLP